MDTNFFFHSSFVLVGYPFFLGLSFICYYVNKMMLSYISNSVVKKYDMFKKNPMLTVELSRSSIIASVLFYKGS